MNTKNKIPYFLDIMPQIEDYEAFKKGKPMQIDLTKTEESYRKLYGFNGNLDDYVFENDTPTYIYGLENAKNYKKTNPHR